MSRANTNWPFVCQVHGESSRVPAPIVWWVNEKKPISVCPFHWDMMFKLEIERENEKQNKKVQTGS
jgi:hypothetical protein